MAGGAHWPADLCCESMHPLTAGSCVGLADTLYQAAEFTVFDEIILSGNKSASGLARNRQTSVTCVPCSSCLITNAFFDRSRPAASARPRRCFSYAPSSVQQVVETRLARSLRIALCDRRHQ